MKGQPGITNIHTLYENDQIVFNRALLAPGKVPVLVKAIKNLDPSSALALLENEKQMADAAAGDGVLKVLDLVDHIESPFLIFDDISGSPLAMADCAGILDTYGFLAVALRLAMIFSGIHKKGILHNNISPWAIFVSIENTRRGHEKIDVAVTSFERSCLIGNDTGEIMPASSMTSLQYASPEATGKVNKATDARSDLYSIGAVLYELAAGRPPFVSDTAAGLIYAHISEIPAELKHLNAGIPPVISRIIMKLLNKNPESRYQSANGLAADLSRCVEMMSKNGAVRSFSPGRFDPEGPVIITDRLLDRQSEMKTLSVLYDDTCRGENILLMVTGPAGTGKTALARELEREVVKGGGFFISGKFDQYRRDIPFSAFITAFEGLMRRILVSPGTEIEAWKMKIMEALHPHAGLITNMVPGLEAVIGRQRPVPGAEPASIINRLNFFLQKFVGVFAYSGHPLVIFLDDLHWADSASRGLMRTLALNDDLRHFCIIGAYRDDETGPDHPLTALLEAVGHEKKICSVAAGPIGVRAIGTMIADSFHTATARGAALAEIVSAKTMGNPFSVRQFLAAVAPGTLARLDPKKGWIFDLEGIRRLPAADNVVEFLTRKISRIHTDLQICLMTASCAGSIFSREVLAGAIGLEAGAIQSAINCLVEEGMIYRDGASYRFVHDRIQEAAYGMMPQEQRTAAHYRIGKALLESSFNEGIADSIFAVVDHLNEAVEIMDDHERIELADLNYLAGMKARSHAAFAQALAYFRAAYNQLHAGVGAPGKDSGPAIIWDAWYHLCYAVHLSLAEAEFMNGYFGRAEETVNEALKYAIHIIDRAELYNVLILQYTLEGRYQEAYDAGLTALQLLGTDITIRDPESSILEMTGEIEKRLTGITLDSLYRSPTIEEHRILLTLKIIRNLTSSAINITFNHALLISLKALLITIEHGKALDSIHAYLLYGMMLCGRANYDRGYDFGKLALDISLEFDQSAYKCESYLKFCNFIALWKIPLSRIAEMNRVGLQAGMESGDLKFTGDIYAHSVLNPYHQGINLYQVLTGLEKAILFIRKIKSRLIIEMLEGQILIIKSLVGYTDIDIASFIEQCETYVRTCGPNMNFMSKYELYGFAAQVLFLFDEYATALELINEGKKLIHYLPTSYHIAEMIYYQSIIITALYPGSSEDQKNDFDAILSENVRSLEHMSANCPGNFSHKHILLEAEIARISGRGWDALDRYDRAIERARANGFTQDAAIANELAGKYWLAKGKKDIAGLYLKHAFESYKKWGARSKVHALEARYADLLRLYAGEQRLPPCEPDRKRLECGNDEDLYDISRRILCETDLERLMDTLLTVTVRYSSAQKGYVLTERNDSFVLEAEIDPVKRNVRIRHALPLSDAKLPLTVLRYAVRTGETVHLNYAADSPLFGNDPYIARYRPGSILCHTFGVINKEPVIIFLENRIMPGAFSSIPRAILGLLSSQMVIAIKNIRLRAEWNDAGRTKNIEFRKRETRQKTKKGSKTGLNCKDGDNHVLIPYDDIIYLSSHAKHTVIHSIEKSIKISAMLKDCTGKLPASLFKRVHKQYIVNFNFVSHYQYFHGGQYVIFLNDDEKTTLPMGRKYFYELKNKFY